MSEREPQFKRALPTWRAHLLGSVSESVSERLYFDYTVEDVRTQNPQLRQLIASFLIDEFNTGDISAPITGELFDDMTVAYTAASIRHDDLVDAERKKRENVLAHFKIMRHHGVGVWTTDLTRINPLIRFIQSSRQDRDVRLLVETATDLYLPYEEAVTHYSGTLGDYPQTII